MNNIKFRFLTTDLASFWEFRPLSNVFSFRQRLPTLSLPVPVVIELWFQKIAINSFVFWCGKTSPFFDDQLRPNPKKIEGVIMGVWSSNYRKCGIKQAVLGLNYNKKHYQKHNRFHAVTVFPVVLQIWANNHTI